MKVRAPIGKGKQGSYFFVCCVTRIIVPERKGAEVGALEKAHTFVREMLYILACRVQPHRGGSDDPYRSLSSSGFDRHFHGGPDYDGIGCQDYSASSQVGKRTVSAIEPLEPVQFSLLKRNHLL
jgi:hypothetical protein